MGRSALSLIILFAMVFIVQSTTATASEKISLQLRWDHQFQFAGYYAAKWQGYYDEAGLDVEIRSAVTEDGEILRAVKEVASGRADFGIGAADILIARDQGNPLVVSAVIFQESASTFYARAATKFDSPRDLVHLKVARNVNDLIDVEFQAMLRAEGIDPSLVRAYPRNSDIENFLSGSVDVIPGYSISIPSEFQERGIQIKEMHPATYGVDFYGDSLFTSECLIKDNPELVKKFTAASLKGWRYALENSDKIAEKISEELPRRAPVENLYKLNKFQIKGVKKLSHYSIVDLGHINPLRWERMHSFLKQSGLVSGILDLDSFIYDPVRIEQKRKKQVQSNLWGVTILLVLFSATAILFIVVLRRVVRLRTKALLQSEERFDLAMQATMDGLYDWNLETDDIYYSPRYKIMLGYAEHELESTPDAVFSLVHPDDIDRLNDYLDQYLAGTIDKFKIEFRLRQKSGTYITVLSRATVLRRGSGGKPLRMVGTHVDISKQKQLELSLVEMDKMKSEFISTAAHELRTPLTAMMGFTDFVINSERYGGFTEKQKLEFLNDVYDRGESLSRLIDDLLDVSRIESGHPIVLELEGIDVEELLVKAVNSFRVYNKKHSFRLDLPDELRPRMILIDRHRINQVLENLLNNAVKYSAQGTEIVVTARTNAGWCEIRVEDRGIGMSQEQVEKIFDKFYRADGSDTAISGLGLGMSIAKQIIISHGGSINVESDEGQGTTVIINLPCAEEVRAKTVVNS